jgi:predicted nucleic acid-binding protein
MILVDTSVWIDLFANNSGPEIELLIQGIYGDETICFTGVILQEIFQGVSSSKQRKEIEDSFAPFVEIFPSRSTYLLAAELFRKSRSNGHPIRSSVDCLIAACCIEHDLELLEKDRDFKYLCLVSNLKLLTQDK